MTEIAALAFLCLFIVIATLAVVAAELINRTLLSLDGLLLAGICLMVAAFFSFVFLWLAHDSHLLDWLKRRKPAASPAPEEPTPKE